MTPFTSCTVYELNMCIRRNVAFNILGKVKCLFMPCERIGGVKV